MSYTLQKTFVILELVLRLGLSQDHLTQTIREAYIQFIAYEYLSVFNIDYIRPTSESSLKPPIPGP